MMSNFILTDECYKSRSGINSPLPQPLKTLTCAKNDTAAFQVLCDNDGKRCILNPGESPALSYEMNLTRFRISVESRFAATVYAEGYMKDESGVLRAELLLSSPQTYDGGIYAPAFITLDIPENTPAGVYPVTVRIFESCGAHNETHAATLNLSLSVANFSVPSLRNSRCYLDLWQHNSNIARTYGTELWSDEHFEKIKLILSSLSALGQKSVTVVAGDCPWRGWGCYLLKDYPATLFEYSMARVTKETSGKYSYDFEVMRRYVELCFSLGIDGDITVYGLAGIWTNMPLFNGAAPENYPEKVLIRYLDQTDGCYKYMTDGADIKNYVKALFEFFRENKLFDKVRIGADEPADHNAYTANVAVLKSIAPDLQFKMALDKTSAIELFGEQTSDLAASFPCSCNNGTLLRKYKNKGNRILWYVCNIPDKPNTVLHSELTELRALGAIGYLFGFDGFLRWAYTCWTDKPLEDIRYNNTALPAGDVNFIYPAKSGGIIYTLRYFALKKALRDYELLNMLSDRRMTDQAMEAVRTVIKNTDTETYMKDDFHTVSDIYSDNYADYEKFNSLIYNLLERR